MHLAVCAAVRSTSRLVAAVAVASCLWLPWPLLAQSAAPPDSIFGLYQGKPVARALGPDRVRVTSKGGDKVGLAVKLYFGHGQLCVLEESGRWTGSSVLIEAEGLKEDEKCELEATFDSGAIHLSDKEQRCTPVYCGARGTLDGASTPKKAAAK
jgi:hypothetical protein